MKRPFLLWLLTAALLCGCGAVPQETEAPTLEPSVSIQPAATVPSGIVDAVRETETQTGGAVRSYSLSIPGCQDVFRMGNGILVRSEAENGTRLTLLTGEPLVPAADKVLDTKIASLQTCPDGVSFFDEGSKETVLLDESLREITRISAPEGMVGTPLLSEDRQTLYYATPDSICALALESRLPRTLRQYTGPALSLDGLHLNGTVLKCSRRDGDRQTLFLSTENGQLLQELEGQHDFVSDGQRYITAFRREEYDHLLFAAAGEEPRALYIPDSPSAAVLLPDSFAVLCITAGEETRMDYYDLTSGRLTSRFTLTGSDIPAVLDAGSGVVWLLDGSTLYRWDTAALPTGEDRVYTGLWYPRSNPDLEGIARCQALAQEIGQRHGVEILVWEDVYTLQPWDYRMTEEHLVPLLEASLAELDQQLRLFPAGFFETLSEDFSGLTVCLVRQMRGNTDNGSVEQASGLQYWIEDHACIALSTVNASKGSFYHELCHVLDTRIMAHSNAYDQWEALNPSGFAYDYDYAANATRNAGEYLRDAERCFIDTYSMSFPKEDRARILEYAMTEGNDHYFQSKTMQNKLRQICIGIREAFGLKKSPDTFLWEQYLQEPLAYTK